MFLSLLCALFASQAQAQDRQIIDKVVGKVGSELILLSEIEDQFDLLRQQRGTLEPEFRCNVLENLLAQNLLLNQARLDSIVIANEEIDAQLDARFERILAYMNNDVKQFEAYYGQTVNEVREQFREDLRSKLMVDRMRANILQGINVTPSEVKTFFKSIPKDSLPYFNSEVEVGEIVYKPKVNEEQKNIAIKQLEDIQQRIKEGEPFEELAKKYSMDPGSGRVGGDLGWQKRGTFVPEFEAAAYNLEKGQYSEIIETEFGYHLLQLIERRGNTIRVRHILIKPEITDADLEKAQNVLDSIRSLILPDSITFSSAVKRFGDENQQSYNNDGTMINPKTGNSFFEIGDLDPDVYFTLDTMEINDVSAPFSFRQPTGETYYRMVLLKSRTSPHKANLQQDYSKIKDAALESKKSGFINDWVIQKIGQTYITIDASYEGCPNLGPWRESMVNQP